MPLKQGKKTRVCVMMTEENPFGREILMQLGKQNMRVDAVIIERGTDLAKTAIHYLENPLYMPPSFSSLMQSYPSNVYYTSHQNSSECKKLLKQFRPAILILGGCRILKPHILGVKGIKTINVHPGILPKYRGLDVVAWSLYHDDPVGYTCHFVVPGVDAGNIIHQEIVEYKNCKTLLEVRLKTMRKSVEIIPRIVTMLQTHPRYKGKKQDETHAQRFFAFPSKKLPLIDEKVAKQFNSFYAT